MRLALGILLFLGTVAAMEGFAYVMHRWVMHGPGWFLHKSHHEPRSGAFEANDWYAVIFAAPSIALVASFRTSAIVARSSMRRSRRSAANPDRSQTDKERSLR